MPIKAMAQIHHDHQVIGKWTAGRREASSS